MDNHLLSVIVPVKDEAATLAELIGLVEAAEVPGMAKQIVVVDDGSTDDTPAILREYEGRPGFLVLRHARNEGKGRAVRTAIEHVKGSVVVIQDADLEYDPSQYAELVAPILAGDTRVVYGSRFLGSAKGMAWANLVANKVLAWMATALGPARITDEATCFKAFDTHLLRSLPLRCSGFEFCPEVTGILQSIREPIVEVPIHYAARSRQKGKKVRASDGVTAVAWLFWSRFARRRELRRVGLTQRV